MFTKKTICKRNPEIRKDIRKIDLKKTNQQMVRRKQK